MRRRAQRKSERGFAMLLVFAMAASVVVMLYLEAPRLATESLRAKEQLLIDRGEQYQRAIQVFVRTIRKYPQTLDELEKFQDKRFLRQRYKDPFTGEDEWRLIHADISGAFPDSKVYGPKNKEEEQKSQQTFIGELPSLGDPNGGLTEPNAQNPALQRRASDRPAIASGQGGDTGAQADPNAAPGDPNQPQNQPGSLPGNPAGIPGAPGTPGSVPVIPNAPGIPGMPSFRPANPIQTPGQGQPGNAPGASPGASGGGFIGGAIPAPGGVSSSQSGGSSGFIGGGGQAGAAGGVRPGGVAGVGGAPGVPGGLPTGGPGQVPTAAADLIRQILTTPRAGGLQGVQGAAQGGLGAGIAGVASKKEATGIKVYNERTRYDEWEFLYDQSKDARSAIQAAGVNAQGTNQPGGPLQSGQSTGTKTGSGSGLGTRTGLQTGTPTSPSTGTSSGVGGFIGGSIPAPPAATPSPGAPPTATPRKQ